MKLCLINNLYKPFARGGAEKITSTIAQGLLSAGHEVFIITTKPYFKQLKIKNYELKIYYLNSLYHNLNRFPKFLRFFWQLWDMFNFINYFKIKKILKREKCDVVITNNLMGLGFLAPLAIRRLKLKQAHLVHDIQLIHPSGLLCFGQEKIINGFFARNYAGLSSQLFASPKIVIFPSRWLMNLHLDKIFFIKSKRMVLPNPVALEPVGFASRAGAMAERTFELKRAGQSFKFLYLGQIEKHKGLSLLIQAFKKIKEKFPLAELTIAGDGAELERAKMEAGQAGGIKFLGWQNESQVDELLRDCHSLVLPTLCYENCPAVILEAFSAGLPVIAADLGGISELLGETAGVLFRPGKAADLADKMEWVIENKDKLGAIIKAGREKAASGNVENYIKELERLMR